MSTEHGWRTAATRYLAKLGDAEYRNHLTQGGLPGRYSPTEYHRDLIELLTNQDEIGFKQLRDQRGQDSALNH